MNDKLLPPHASLNNGQFLDIKFLPKQYKPNFQFRFSPREKPLHSHIFLNIYPEHLDSHGGFENYRLAKSILFKNLAKEAFYIANGESEQLEHSRYMFKQIPVEVAKTVKDYYVSQVRDYKIIEEENSIFRELSIDNHIIKTGFVVNFEISNLVFVLKALMQIDKKLYYKALELKNMEFLGNLPGRMQWVIWDNHLIG